MTGNLYRDDVLAGPVWPHFHRLTPLSVLTIEYLAAGSPGDVHVRRRAALLCSGGAEWRGVATERVGLQDRVGGVATERVGLQCSLTSAGS